MKKAKLLLAIFGLSMLTFHCIAQSSITNNPIKIGELLVARSDFKMQMKWAESRKACEKLKGGWRLPNSVEYELTEKTGWVVEDLHTFPNTFKLRVQFLTTPVRDLT